MDLAGIHYDAGLVNRTSPSGWNDEVELRRGRIFVAVRAFEHLELKTEVDFAPEDPSLTDAYLGVRRIGPIDFVRFGHQKLPFSLEQEMSSKYLVFMERSLANALDPSVRDIGLRAQGTLFAQRLHWALGGFVDTLSTGYRVADPTQWKLATRVTGLPYWSREGKRLVHVGVSYSHRFSTGSGFSIEKTPESFLADKLLDTGAIAGVGSQDRIGAEFVWLYGPFSLQAEVVYDRLDRDVGSGGLEFVGGYGQVSWFATGEHRVYSKARAVFGQVHPRRNFDPVRGGWGALELGARLSYADLDDGDVRGGRQTDTTLAINWLLFPILRLSFNWVHGWVHGQGDVDVLQGRFQLEY